MKKKFTIFIITISLVLLPFFIINALSQGPPPPPPNPGSGGTPIGGGAPIGGGVVILFALGAGYLTKKIYDVKKMR